jgi:hypothetical protein
MSPDWNTRSFVLVSATIAWLLPMLTICGCYGGIIRQTKDNARMMRSLLTREDSSAISQSQYSSKRVTSKSIHTQTEKSIATQRTTTEETVGLPDLPTPPPTTPGPKTSDEDDDDASRPETREAGLETMRLRALNRFPRILSVTSDTSDTDTGAADHGSPSDANIAVDPISCGAGVESYTSRNMKVRDTPRYFHSVSRC